MTGDVCANCGDPARPFKDPLSDNERLRAERGWCKNCVRAYRARREELREQRSIRGYAMLDARVGLWDPEKRRAAREKKKEASK